MAFVIADRVRESSTTTGTGSIALGGAVTGYQTFGSVLTTGDTTYYTIADQGGANWEVGIGTFTSPSTLARTTILSSSNGGSIVTFTAGTKDVFISLPASKTNTNDQPNVIAVNSTSDALRITQTGTGNALVVEDAANPDATPFVVTATGDVGVGEFAPAFKLDILGTLHSSGQATLDSGILLATSTMNFVYFNDAVTFYRNGIAARVRIESDGQVQIGAGTVSSPALSTLADSNTGIFFPAADTVAIVEGGTEALRVDSSANLLVGTTTAVSKLTVSGDVAGTFFVNPTTVSANYTVPTNYNAMTAGPITVNSGVVVTVGSGSVWTIV